MHSSPFERRKSPLMLSIISNRLSSRIASWNPRCRSRIGVESSVPLISAIRTWSIFSASAFRIRYSPARRPSA